MNIQPRTQAENTVLLLQDAADGGRDVLIPGSLDVRVGPSRVQAIAASERAALPREQPAAIVGPDLLEYEREGGGAPSERPRTTPPASTHGTPAPR